MTPAREDAKNFSSRYLKIFDELLGSSLENHDDALKALELVKESSRFDY